ncbi:MAG: PqqD family protein [Devosia sp.]|jgi:hypothetical protein
MGQISAGSRFEAVGGVEITEVPDGRVVYQASRDKVHYLNPTAIIVFELCTSGQSAGEIATFLKDAYGLDEPPTESVDTCIRSLLDEGLLRPSTP